MNRYQSTIPARLSRDSMTPASLDHLVQAGRLARERRLRRWFRRLEVLLVEPAEEEAEQVMAAFKEWGRPNRLTVASHLEQALGLLRDPEMVPPHLILVDDRLPRLNAALGRLREAAPRRTRIAVLGSAQAADAAPVCRKPLNLREIAKLCDRYRLGGPAWSAL